MRTVRFKFVGWHAAHSNLHVCLEAGDNSGEYIRVDEVRELVEAAKVLVADKDYQFLDDGIGVGRPVGIAWLRARGALKKLEAK